MKMTTRFKDFGDGGVVVTEPLSFKLHGEEFHCKPAVQGKVLLDMVQKAGSGDQAAATEVITDFFNSVLAPESKTRFDALLESDKIVTVETLGEITSWVVEQYTSRPTSGPEQSQSGQ
jgi:hypothetical protein